MNNEEKLDFIMEKLLELTKLRDRRIKFNEIIRIDLWDNENYIEFVIKGSDDDNINWDNQLPTNTNFSMKLFSIHNIIPFRIECHKDDKFHRNIDDSGNNIHEEQKKYNYEPFYSTLSSCVAGFPEERDLIRKGIKTHLFGKD